MTPPEPLLDPLLERANRALFEGDRTAVIELLQDHAVSGAALWLLASAVEDNNERLGLLRPVHATGELPYAELAADILRREAKFEESLHESPSWQRWLSTRRDLIWRVCITAFVFSVVVLVLALLFSA